jgi:hypothetical protein
MLFNKKTADEIVIRSGLAAAIVLEMFVEGETSVKEWLAAEPGDIGRWPFYATVACTFLALEKQGEPFSDEDFRQFAVLVNESLYEWDDNATEAFYELADFVVTSAENKVGSVAASSLWVIMKVMENNPSVEDLAKAYNVGQYFTMALARSYPVD